MYKFGAIGLGNMGSAVVDGIIKSQVLKEEDIIIYDLNEKAMEKYADTDMVLASSIEDLARQSQAIFLGLIPQVLKSVGEEIRDLIKKDSLIISIAAGTPISKLKEYFGQDKKYIRVMSNTPATIGQGMTAIAPDESARQEDVDFVKDIFSSIGLVEEVDEDLLSVYTGFIGSLPAYVFTFIEAVGDAAVADGFPRAGVYEMIAQTIQGSAKLLLESKKHPAQLKDQVTSAGGTTIAGLAALEEEGFRNAVIKGIRSASARAKEME